MTLPSCVQPGQTHVNSLAFDQDLLPQWLQQLEQDGHAPAKPESRQQPDAAEPDLLSASHREQHQRRPEASPSPAVCRASAHPHALPIHDQIASARQCLPESVQPHDANIKLRLKNAAEKRPSSAGRAVALAALLAVWAALLAPPLLSLTALCFVAPGPWLALPCGLALLVILWLSDQTGILGSSANLATTTAASPEAGQVRRRVAVIGAGPAGLAAVKELKQAGHEAVCFERLHAVGGLWVMNDQQFCVPSYTVMVTSAATTSFSDFPFSIEGAMPTAQEFLSYLQRYAERFDLMPHVQLETEVVSVRPLHGGAAWQVTTRQLGGAEQSSVFDAVACCSGQCSQMCMPDIPGRSAFQGMILPLTDIKGAEIAAGKRTVVVGFGDSAADLAHNAARVSGQPCYLSTARGKLVVPRVSNRSGLPSDFDHNRIRAAVAPALSDSCVLASRRVSRLLSGSDAAEEVQQYCLEQATAPPRHSSVLRSAQFAEEVAAGRLALKPFVDHFTDAGVVFKDGSFTEADLVIFCTGFQPSLGYIRLPPTLASEVADCSKLYKHMFHPDLGANFAMLGYAQPTQGAVSTIVELQARWFAALQSGCCALPDPGTMREDAIACEFEAPSQARAGYVQYVPYLDSLAEMVGCRPSVKLLLRSPCLLLKLLYGPVAAAQYRLSGLGACPEQARQAIMQLPVTATVTQCAAFTGLHFYSWCLSLVGCKQLMPATTAI